MTILVIAEHDGNSLKPATLSTLGAAQQLGEEIHLLILSDQAEQVAKEAVHVSGITKVLIAERQELAHSLAEPITEVVMELASGYQYILAPATTFGKNLLPRIAALLDVMQISDIIKVISQDTFERPIYAGNAIMTVQSRDPIKVMTVRPTAFPKAAKGQTTASIEKITPKITELSSTFVAMAASTSERPELSAARIVVSGGRGLGNKDNFVLVEKLADCLKAAIGASRAAVDAGFVPNDYQVGQTGKVVAPDLYIAVGISGAIQHLAGMKDSKVIVAINKDPDAPIFQVADYGLVGDLFEIVPQLTKELCGESV
jgi:electron transfer flavoprotein alpha subunit